ncbi:hypothetical protein C9374_009828 [Naegleria lovaniensis]|uniref:EF-hand domain-containing protein n=1 Tax=Naegleria lovaniensis TaxID=51637 RepID=A0AA88H5S0_NAELO|nr:uncharacterized protein C9374_009828 [Naegleria lovaniensis]KAG2393251.1 hypothetical protein C9374_009828 [Naegleria lovaniensis]
MHSTFSVPVHHIPTTSDQEKNKDKFEEILNHLWFKGKKPEWLPNNFYPRADLFQQRDDLIQQAEHLFFHYDTNRTFAISKQEFKMAFQQFGLEPTKAKNLSRIVHSSENGLISLEEFINAYIYVNGGGEIWDVQEPSQSSSNVGRVTASNISEITHEHASHHNQKGSEITSNLSLPPSDNPFSHHHQQHQLQNEVLKEHLIPKDSENNMEQQYPYPQYSFVADQQDQQQPSRMFSSGHPQLNPQLSEKDPNAK